MALVVVCSAPHLQSAASDGLSPAGILVRPSQDSDGLRLGGSSPGATNGTTASLEALTQAYQRLQAEVRAARENQESGGRASDGEALRVAERLGQQLNRVERELEAQKQEKQQILRVVEASSHQNLLYASLFAGVALLAVMAMSFLQLRATAKLTDLALSTSGIQERLQLLASAELPRSVASPSVTPAPSSERLLQSVDRLERRLLELEGAARAPLAAPSPAASPIPDSAPSPRPVATPVRPADPPAEPTQAFHFPEVNVSSTVAVEIDERAAWIGGPESREPATPRAPASTASVNTPASPKSSGPEPTSVVIPAPSNGAAHPAGNGGTLSVNGPALEPVGSRILSRPTPPAEPAPVPAPAPATPPARNGGPGEVQEAGASISEVTEMLGRGEALLQLGQADAALACFEEALAVDDRNAEAWVKKGSALEKLERIEQALACYDKAITLDQGSTLAYLYKGGVCNRLERFDEALACYELALRSQERPQAS